MSTTAYGSEPMRCRGGGAAAVGVSRLTARVRSLVVARALMDCWVSVTSRRRA
ncbi:hypothetical protein ACTWPT_58870 [Nonomuraea sp. 3N208]|uniref:hypothetical protein n=1 Tax=Nonomuraea sp. 3N208 TaxID=3457421 RepID=UPI003FD3ECF9